MATDPITKIKPFSALVHNFDNRVDPDLIRIMRTVGDRNRIRIDTTSGHRGPGGSGRHNHTAMDAALYSGDRRLSVTNPQDLPLIQGFTRDFAREAYAAGYLPSAGWANHNHDVLYMGGNTGHFDIAVGNSIAPTRGRVWGGSGKRSAHVPAPAWLSEAILRPDGFEPGVAPPMNARNNGSGPYTSLPHGARPTREQAALVEQAARAAGIDPNLYLRVIAQESAFSDDVWSGSRRSTAGAIGPAQLMPGTAAQLNVDPYDIRANLAGGARYLAEQLKRFNGDVSLALAAYNAGPGAVAKHGGIPPFAETQQYVSSILGSSGDGPIQFRDGGASQFGGATFGAAALQSNLEPGTAPNQGADPEGSSADEPESALSALHDETMKRAALRRASRSPAQMAYTPAPTEVIRTVDPRERHRKA